mmetsp:Transcript_50446/g.141172  ORF Transcript_50446/g.141172 Transcript_50446/m.141172 type:complete len:161 (-) Transcript_50446:91-573(-)
MGKKRWNPPSGPSVSDNIANRRKTALSWEERREIVESTKKVKGSSSLREWEAHNIQGSVDEQLQKNFELKVARKAVEKAKKKAEKRAKKEEKKAKKKEKKKKKDKKDKKKKKKESDSSSSGSSGSSSSSSEPEKKKAKFEKEAKTDKEHGWRLSSFLGRD